MNKRYFFLMGVILASIILTSSKNYAQKPVAVVAERLSKTLETKVSLEDVNGYTTDSLVRTQPKSVQKNNTLPVYPEIRKDDVLFSETIWEDIDGREKKNRAFLNEKEDETGQHKFFEVLLNILDADTVKLKVYKDDRFSMLSTREDLLSTLKGPLETKKIERAGGDSVTVSRRNTAKADVSDHSQIYSFRIKAQYIYDNRTSRMHYRIIALAPLVAIRKLADNNIDSITVKQPLFWIPYLKIRDQLGNRIADNPNNEKKNVPWAVLLESRYFDRQVVKSSLKNPNDKDLFELYPDPKKRLEAAEKIMQRIEEFDQTRWVY
jgi:gliding motility associated protien GldN